MGTLYIKLHLNDKFPAPYFLFSLVSCPREAAPPRELFVFLPSHPCCTSTFPTPSHRRQAVVCNRPSQPAMITFPVPSLGCARAYNPPQPPPSPAPPRAGDISGCQPANSKTKQTNEEAHRCNVVGQQHMLQVGGHLVLAGFVHFLGRKGRCEGWGGGK